MTKINASLRIAAHYSRKSNDCAWCYDGIDRHAHRLPGTLYHLPPNKVI
jgi:hypothetical protein